jgi:penicillin amidase
MYPARASGALIQLLRAADPGWLTGTGYASWEELKRASLIQAVLDLRARLGDDVDAWRWGALHQVSFDHVFARIKPLAPLFRRGPYPIGGDADTPHQASSASGDFGVCDWVPSYRQVVDLANLSASIAMHAPGQSGLPGSPHYDDFVQPWRAGRYHPMLFARQEVLANMEHLLVLRAQTR